MLSNYVLRKLIIHFCFSTYEVKINVEYIFYAVFCCSLSYYSFVYLGHIQLSLLLRLHSIILYPGFGYEFLPSTVSLRAEGTE